MCIYTEMQIFATPRHFATLYTHMWSRERVVSVEMHFTMLFAMQRLSVDLINKIASVQIWPLHIDPITAALSFGTASLHGLKH